MTINDHEKIRGKNLVNRNILLILPKSVLESIPSEEIMNRRITSATMLNS